MSHTYAGVGSRTTPQPILGLIIRVATLLMAQGWKLRTGGAQGADRAFSDGTTANMREVYIPWDKFGGFHQGNEGVYCGISQAALDMAAMLHPAWDRCKSAAKKLHARNCYQILGQHLNDPVSFVICWTPDGAQTAAECGPQTGGTATAIRLADKFGIPVFNLARHDSYTRVISGLEL